MARQRTPAVAIAALIGMASFSFLPVMAQAASRPDTVVTWYYPETNTYIPANQSQLQAAINKITEPRIGVQVHLVPIISGDYQKKLSVMLETGQATGIVWTSNWLLPWTNEVSARAFTPLNSLIGKYGAGLQRTIGKKYLRGMAFDGKIYAVPSLQMEVNQAEYPGQLTVQDAKALHLKLTKLPSGAYEAVQIHSLASLHNLLVSVHKKFPKLVPMVAGSATEFVLNPATYGYWSVVPASTEVNPTLPFFIKVQAKYGKTPPKITLALGMLRKNIAMMHQWYEQGLINKNAGSITATEATQLNDAGTSVFNQGNFAPAWNPAQESSTTAPGHIPIEVVIKTGPLHGAFMFTGDASTANAIAAATPPQEQAAAMKLLNLVNTDPQVYNLLAYGIPKVDYTMAGPNSIRYTKAGRDFANGNWVYGDIFKGFVPAESNAPHFSWTYVEKMDREAVASPAVGFNFNDTAVQTQIADISSVTAQWIQPLLSGVYPPSKLKQFEAAMNQAGQQTVLKAVTKQFDAWWKLTHK